MYVYRNGGLVAFGRSGVDNSETFLTQVLPADTYVAALQDWRYEDDEGAPVSYPDRMCFNVSFTPQ